MSTRRYIVPAVALLFVAWTGCAETTEPSSPSERFDRGSTTEIGEELPYSSDPVEFSGSTDIRTLLDISKRDFVWMGTGEGDPYPTGRKREFGAACEPDFGNKVYKLSELPATIEGVVTLTPRNYQKPSLCGQDHRFYGSYYIQDSTGSILVLKDSRIADFDVGDRVKLKVRGLLASFGTKKVSAFEEVEIERDRGPAPYETVDQSFEDLFGAACGEYDSIPEGLGDNYRVSGKVCQPPTTRNFGAVVIYPSDADCSEEPDKTWRASLGLELEPRVLDLKAGEEVTVTGPVTCSFGNYSMAVSNVAQFDQYRESADDE